MIREILIDCVPFGIMLIICISMFANAILIMDQSRVIEGLDPITESAFGWGPIDAAVRIYMLGMGEYSVDNYGTLDNKIAWFVFVAATIIL